MKKAIKIGIISLSTIVVLVFTSLFFLLDLALVFINNSNNESGNYSVEGIVNVGGLSTEIDLAIDGNKIKVHSDLGVIYIEDIGSAKYIYTPKLFGGYSKTKLTNESETTAFVSLLDDLEREDFIFKTIGYYEMNEEKLEEENLEFMSITFKFDGILMSFKYSDNISYSIKLKDFGKSKVILPN